MVAQLSTANLTAAPYCMKPSRIINHVYTERSCAGSAMLPTITPTTLDIPPGGAVILRHQTWDDYETLLQTRQENAAIKITFSAKSQEIRIMSSLPGHGKKSDTLADLVKCLLSYQKQDWDGFDPITLKRFQKKGLEPDHPTFRPLDCHIRNNER